MPRRAARRRRRCRRHQDIEHAQRVLFAFDRCRRDRQEGFDCRRQEADTCHTARSPRGRAEVAHHAQAGQRRGQVVSRAFRLRARTGVLSAAAAARPARLLEMPSPADGDAAFSPSPPHTYAARTHQAAAVAAASHIHRRWFTISKAAAAHGAFSRSLSLPRILQGATTRDAGRAFMLFGTPAFARWALFRPRMVCFQRAPIGRPPRASRAFAVVAAVSRCLDYKLARRAEGASQGRRECTSSPPSCRRFSCWRQLLLRHRFMSTTRIRFFFRPPSALPASGRRHDMTTPTRPRARRRPRARHPPIRKSARRSPRTWLFVDFAMMTYFCSVLRATCRKHAVRASTPPPRRLLRHDAPPPPPIMSSSADFWATGKSCFRG